MRDGTPIMGTLERRLAAMTVNERLSELGLLESWDAAVAARDRKAMAKILHQIFLDHQAESIIESALKRSS